MAERRLQRSELILSVPSLHSWYNVGPTPDLALCKDFMKVKIRSD